MKWRILRIACLFLMPLAAFSQTNDEILSSKFVDTNSVDIKLNYEEYDGCLGYFVGRIDLQIRNNIFGFRHFTTSEIFEYDFFRGINKDIVEYFIEFETNSKKENPRCYGIAGDHCFAIELSINEQKTKFMYKLTDESSSNQLAVLLEKLEKLNKISSNDEP